MKLDRALQKNILLKLAETYPLPNGNELHTLCEDINVLTANIFYLQEHDLIRDFQLILSVDAEATINIIYTTITKNGMDFLAADGGLSAILGTITVKFHEDTLKALLTSKIQSANIPDSEKSTLLSALKNLSGKALEQVITKLVDLGFENADQAIPLLKIVFESLQKSVS
ncbi:hypothetical protein BKG93_07895 [Rodentibacter ratti]|uniref:Uncharacterized protein n=1 Tax=Rodentibacter ratti TaxID=1906745 RepID=A0A1V3L4A1_9PAST|nr:hypothetical protein [Rodentibacter ratti]OOF84440.1 hypothetical protein BKG93_07895 [Rodentibacter ratti]